MKTTLKPTGFIYDIFVKNVTLTSLLFRISFFLFTWWVLTNGDVSSWWVGLPAVLLSTTVSILLFSPVDITFLRLAAFIPLFLIYSFKGAVDIALRVFHPRLPISPEIVKYSLSLPPGLPRVFMVNLVNLVPGTLTVKLEDNELTIHIMDSRLDFIRELNILEEQVSKIFGSSQNFYKGDM
ncbi:MAG: Cation antiporter [uncultured Sulfurovum sp.]|uniref:Cation antiporter n=1 Tax=uncultured Sulfurovum sp. TaxID=269237 RepID=A0A6S6SSJ6_9BACT|nr:MAG: Cation antiporter [uncultured Sulfurovum sp.]